MLGFKTHHMEIAKSLTIRNDAKVVLTTLILTILISTSVLLLPFQITGTAAIQNYNFPLKFTFSVFINAYIVVCCYYAAFGQPVAY